jgi:tetratricopeptide (TPR) repeat protein
MARASAKPATKGAAPRKRTPRQPAAAPAIAEAAPSPKPKRRVSLPSLESGSTQLRKTILNVAFVIAILLFIPILISQFMRDQVLIEPIAVPKALLARGITPEVMASRLWDGLRDAKLLAGTSKTTLSAIPDSQRVEFSVPEVGLSLDSVVRQARQFFNIYQTRIVGEVVCDDAACSADGLKLRLRVLRDTSSVIEMPALGAADLRAYFRDAAVNVLAVLDPFVAISATAPREPVRAIAQARRLIRQHHPDSKWAYVLIGNIRSESGDDRAAVAEYRAALALDPDFVIPKVNLANALRRLGDPEAARALFDELAAAQPGFPKAREGYAELAAGAGRIDEAIALFTELVTETPTDALPPTRIGQLEMQRGNIQAAMTWFARALQIDPAFPPAVEAMLGQALATQDYPETERLLLRTIEAAPDFVEARMGYAEILVALERRDEALAQLERARVDDPDNAQLLFNIGQVLTSLNRQTEAIEPLTRSLELDAYNPATLLLRGTALALINDTAAARIDFNRILEVDTSGIYAPRVPPLLELLDNLEAMDPPPAPVDAEPKEVTP